MKEQMQIMQMSLPNKWGKQNEKKRLNNPEQEKILEKKYKIAEKQKIYHKKWQKYKNPIVTLIVININKTNSPIKKQRFHTGLKIKLNATYKRYT